MMSRLFLLAFIVAALSQNAAAQSSQQTLITGKLAGPVIPSSKVITSFKRSYPGVNNERWSSDNGYYFAFFYTGGVKNQVVYTRNGQLDYSMKTYGEEKLPSAVRSIIKSVYYDYQITNVKELDVKHKMIYVISINDSKTWKTIRLHNGELEEIENYSTVISPCR